MEIELSFPIFVILQTYVSHLAGLHEILELPDQCTDTEKKTK